MKNIGIDIVEVDRIRSIVEKYEERFLHRIFTKTEIEYCKTQRNGFRFTSLAARFAAKEAFYKAVFPLIRHSIPWHDCQVINDTHGVPKLKISEKLNKELKSHLFISLSHSDNYAVAVVVIE